ncbi:phosphoglycerate kinase [Patescibacteria group bacterium]|nr:phosphoglycerate kinase [Patescibacteria group bacterium]MCL5091274.1 phosphoglycerate kinase [Patescibacteria group bacterium]
MKTITYIDQTEQLHDKTVLLRVDYNVSTNKSGQIADDFRITQTLPTIKALLKQRNRIIIITYLGRPAGRDPQFSLKRVAKKLQEYLPTKKVTLIDDFLNTETKVWQKQTGDDIYMLENIRFYPQEKTRDPAYARRIANLGDAYVNDAFGQCHRTDVTLTEIAQFLPAYGGLLLKKEIEMINRTTVNPPKPLVVIMGGVKIATKMNSLAKLITIADSLLIGGGLANTFFRAEGINVGQSYYQYEEVESARRVLFHAKQKHTAIVLPTDVMVAYTKESDLAQVKTIDAVPEKALILDIGPETLRRFTQIIAQARSIIWNGPIGYFENPQFCQGTNGVYQAIADNRQATSIIGGGDTLAAIAHKPDLNKISHLSTGGGAMLEYIEKGTLPGIEALKQSRVT